MKFDLKFILPLVGLILSETFAQFSLEKVVKTKNNIFLVLGCAAYLAVSILYYFVLKTGQKLAIANVIWNIGTTVGVFLVGTFYFKEKLTTKQLIGVALAVVSGFLLN